MTTETQAPADLTCAYCGKPIEAKLRGGARKRYCDSKCRLDAWIVQKANKLAATRQP